MDIQASSLFLNRTSRIVEVPANDVIQDALQADAVSRRVLAAGHEISHGDLVGSRLNLNILKSRGVMVNTIHAATNQSGYRQNKGFWNGKVLSYAPVVQLSDAYFNVLQSGRERIASGKSNKYPMASVDGRLDLESPWRFDGIEIRFNPKRERLFCDLAGRAVHHAEHVTVYGHRAYARGLVSYYDRDIAPVPAGNAPCEAKFFAELGSGLANAS